MLSWCCFHYVSMQCLFVILGASTEYMCNCSWYYKSTSSNTLWINLFCQCKPSQHIKTMQNVICVVSSTFNGNNAICCSFPLLALWIRSVLACFTSCVFYSFGCVALGLGLLLCLVALVALWQTETTAWKPNHVWGYYFAWLLCDKLKQMHGNLTMFGFTTLLAYYLTNWNKCMQT